MPHRLFIAINLPEKIKAKLANFQSNWPELPIRWVEKRNLHITLVFLGSVSDEELPEILEIIEEITSKHNDFSINLNKICYGPPKKMPPRMVWAKGEKSEDLGKLKKDLENSFLASSVKGSFRPENRPYSPHITLGRIRQWEFRRIESEEIPEVNEDISLDFEVNSIEIMESRLKRTGAEYITLKSYKLK